jgi:Fe-S cluster biosynthesis and repair protein YggX
MSIITISEENLSRFNKRLQKALEEFLGTDVKLTDASKLFAKTLGKDSEHELKKALALSPEQNQVTSDALSITEKLQSLEVKDVKLKRLEVMTTHLQSLLNQTTAKYIFMDFDEDREGLFGRSFLIGFNELPSDFPEFPDEYLEDEKILHSDSFDYYKNFLEKNKTLLNDLTLSELHHELMIDKNMEMLEKIFEFKEEYMSLIVNCIDDCDDHIVINNDTITMQLRKNPTVIKTKDDVKVNLRLHSDSIKSQQKRKIK